MTIVQATSPALIDVARELFEEYERSLGIDLCFQNFAEELATLPGKYSPPAGRLLLAIDDEEPAGCIALRPFAAGTGEMKRLYIRASHRGRGLGRLLTEALLDEARAIGYEAIVLDTLPSMAAAHKLYESLGFTETDAYRFNPVSGTKFMRLSL